MKFNSAICFLVVAACYYMPMAASSACPCSESTTPGSKDTHISGGKHATDAETHTNRRKDVLQLLNMARKNVSRQLKQMEKEAVRKDKNCKDYSIIGQVDTKNINRTFEQLVNLTIYTSDLFQDLSLTSLLCNYELTMDNPMTCPVTTFRKLEQAALERLDDESKENDFKFWTLCDTRQFLQKLRKTLKKLTTAKAPKDKPDNGKGKRSDKVGGNRRKSQRKRLGKGGEKPNTTRL